MHFITTTTEKKIIVSWMDLMTQLWFKAKMIDVKIEQRNEYDTEGNISQGTTMLYFIL